MKLLARITCVICIACIMCAAQVRTDNVITPPLSPPPPMPAMNSLFVDARFNNVRILRATDDSLGDPVYATADSGFKHIYSADETHWIFCSPGKPRCPIVALDRKNFKVSATSLSVPRDSGFAWADPQTIFYLQGTIVHKMTAAADWKSAIDAVVVDFASCFGGNFHATWNGIFTPKRDDKTFAIAFSDTSTQGSGRYLVAWRAARGCSVYDTVAGTVGGKPIDDGAKPLLDRFTIHEGGEGQHEDFAMLEASGHQPGGALGCLAGSCTANQPYIWQEFSTHVRPCGPSGCAGHMGGGYTELVNGKLFTTHKYSDPTTPLTHLLPPNSFCSDAHATWNNSGSQDTGEIYASAQQVAPANQVYPCAGYDEIISVDPAHPGIRKRRAQTLSTGNSPYFPVQNAIAISSPHYTAWASDWGGTIKGAVFLMENQ